MTCWIVVVENCINVTIQHSTIFNIFATLLNWRWPRFAHAVRPHQRYQSQRSSSPSTYSMNTLRPYTFYFSASSGIGDTEASTQANQHETAKSTCCITTTSTPIVKSYIPVETPYIIVLDDTILLILTAWLLRQGPPTKPPLSSSKRQCRKIVENCREFVYRIVTFRQRHDSTRHVSVYLLPTPQTLIFWLLSFSHCIHGVAVSSRRSIYYYVLCIVSESL